MTAMLKDFSLWEANFPVPADRRTARFISWDLSGAIPERTKRERGAERVLLSRVPSRIRRRNKTHRERKLARVAGRPRPDVCDVCDGGGRIYFDHHHGSDAFRGWLCLSCNVALGHVKDDPELLRKLAEYLERPR